MVIGYRLMIFGDCPEAAEELKKVCCSPADTTNSPFIHTCPGNCYSEAGPSIEGDQVVIMVPPCHGASMTLTVIGVEQYRHSPGKLITYW